MSADLKAQLENLEDRLPIVPTEHYVMFEKTDTGPVAFLFEQRSPQGEPATLHMAVEVQPTYQTRVYASRKKRLVSRPSRTRFRFTFRRPKREVVLPADAQCPKKAKWMKIADRLYARLRDHDSKAWEELLGDVLDIPSDFGAGSSPAGRG